MSTQLFKQFTDIEIRGKVLIPDHASITDGVNSYPARALFGAMGGGNVITLGDAYVLPADLPGATFICMPKNTASYAVTLGQPGQVGRRFRFILREELDAASESIDIYVSGTNAAENNRVIGVVTMGGNLSNRHFADRRGTGWLGSTTANNRPGPGDWFEFWDLGTRWHVTGACHAAVNGAVKVY